MENLLSFWIVVAAVVAVYGWFGVVIVQQNRAVVIERFGKYTRTLTAGIHIIIPFVDRRAPSLNHRERAIDLRERAIDISKQQAITKDNVALGIDGVLYYKIVDPKIATYGISNLYVAVTQLAQTTMRAQIGQLTLDETFEARERINASVTAAIDEASGAWGTKIMRYEIKDIEPPATIREEMEKQMAAERERRAEVLRSEGYRQAQINQAEGDKRALILRAEGRAESVVVEAKARSESIQLLGEAISCQGGVEAVSQLLAEKYILAFEKLAREGTMAIIPSDSSDISSAVVKGFGAFRSANQALASGKGHDGASPGAKKS